MVGPDASIAVYMLASRRHGTLYIGVTGKLLARIVQHRDGDLPGFTQRYGVTRLVWYEPHGDMSAAIRREKQLKKFRREWKINLIERENPCWEDLFPVITGEAFLKGLPLYELGQELKRTRPDPPK
jgi:putative endonuclease